MSELPEKLEDNHPNPHEKDEVVLVRTSGNQAPELSFVRLASEDQRTKNGDRIGYFVEADEDGPYIIGTKGIKEENLTEDAQAALAQELAEDRPGYQEDMDRKAREAAHEMIDDAPSEEVVENLGETATSEVVEELEDEDTPESSETKEELIDMAKRITESLQRHIDHYAELADYRLEQGEHPTRVGAIKNKLVELNRKFEYKDIDTVVLQQELTTIANDLDLNIAGAYDAFNSRDVDRLVTENLATHLKDEDNTLRRLSDSLTELSTTVKKADRDVHDVKKAAVIVVSTIRSEILPLLAHGIGHHLQDQLYDVAIRQMNQLETLDYTVRVQMGIVRNGLENVAHGRY